jgi:hypothetical protein
MPKSRDEKPNLISTNFSNLKEFSTIKLSKIQTIQIRLFKAL